MDGQAGFDALLQMLSVIRNEYIRYPCPPSQKRRTNISGPEQAAWPE